MVWEGEDGETIDHEVFEFPAPASRWRCTTSTNSIRDFARACFNYGARSAAGRSISRPRTRSSRPMTAASRTCSRKCSTAEFKDKFEAAGIVYEHRLIDDMVASRAQVERQVRLGLQELRRRRPVRPGRAGLRLARPDDLGADDARRQDGRGRGRARHRHPPLPHAPAGQGDLDQPDRLDLRLDPRPDVSAASSTTRPTSSASPRRSSGSASRPSRAAR